MKKPSRAKSTLRGFATLILQPLTSTCVSVEVNRHEPHFLQPRRRGGVPVLP
jgi:hypothetical protein